METSSNRIQYQVRIADTVLLNKVDLAEGQVPYVKNRIHALNPFAKILETHYCETDIDHILNATQSLPVALNQREKHAEFESSGRPPIQSAVIKTTRQVSLKSLEAFLEALPDTKTGNPVRAQLLESDTSPAANYEDAKKTES